MSDFAERLEAAKSAVALACGVCRRVQATIGEHGSMRKGDMSPVTIADYAAQALIARELVERLGGVTIVAEEDSAALRAQMARGELATVVAVVGALKPEWPDATVEEVLAAIDLGAAEPPTDSLHGFWALDPIDGTRGFVRGGQYAVCLAWVENGSPMLGAVGCPNLSQDLSRPLDESDEHGTLYYAIAAEGLCEIPSDDPRASALVIRRLERSVDEPIRLVESVDSGLSRSQERAARVMERLGELGEPVRLDGQTKYVIAARGQGDVYLRLPRSSGYVERIWDHAAGALIAQEAGLVVSDARGRALDFSRGRGLELNRGILVAEPRLHGLALGAIAELGALEPAG